ncbi:MAG: ABC transporter ATP-binding protein [Bacteroidota bacterium]
MNTSEPIISIQHVKKSFGENHVLTDFNLDVFDGESVVVLGRSGCGKSVLIKCIVGLLPYDHGSIKVLGEEISLLNEKELDHLRAQIGFVFQSSALYDSMTVGENLAFPLSRHDKSLNEKQIRMRIMETLENVGLAHAYELMPAELSGGMRKRIGLARALVLRPKIILYDEPTTGLDPITGNEISNLMLEMQRTYHTTSIIISHDLNCSRLTANRMAMMFNGKNHATGTFEELKRSVDPNVHSFFEYAHV